MVSTDGRGLHGFPVSLARVRAVTAATDFSLLRTVRMVGSFDELVSTSFGGEMNALCWERVLQGDYGEVVDRLAVGRGITSIDEERLLALELSANGKLARDMILRDLELLRACELAPSLDCVNGYLHDLEDGAVPTHVQSWHVDSATVEADTWLCTYSGLSSEGLCNDEAQLRVDEPGTRAELLKLYGGQDDDGFAEYLNENFFDLHYIPSPGARPFAFGVGNLWRVATAYPGSPVLPCIHRAPATMPGQPPRLLLIC